MELLSSLKKAYNQVEDDLNQTLSSKDRVQNAEPDEKEDATQCVDSTKGEEKREEAKSLDGWDDWKMDDNTEEKDATERKKRRGPGVPGGSPRRKEETVPSPAKPKSQMESLAKDDLIKYIKKQAQLLQKSKAKNEELAKQVSLLAEEKEKFKASNHDDVLEKFHTVNEVRNQLAEQLHLLSNDYEKLEREHKSSLGELESAQKENETLDREHKASLDELESARNEKAKLEEELSSVVARCSKGDEERNTLTRDLEERTAELSELQRQQEEKEQMREVDDGVDVVDGAALESARDLLKRTEDELEVEKKKVLDREAEFSSLQESLQKKIHSMEVELKRVTGERANALLNVEKEEKRFEEAASQLSSMGVEVKELQSTLHVRDDELVELKEKNSALSCQLETLESSEKSLKERMTGVERERDRLEGLAEELREHKTAFETENETLKRELAGEQEKVQMGERKLKEAEQRLEKAAKEANQTNLIDLELADYQRTIEALEGDLAAKIKEIEKRKNENEQNEQRIVALKKDIELADAQRSQVEERATKMKAVLVKTRKELVDTRNEREEQKKREVELLSQIEIQNQANEEAKLETAKLMAENQSLQEQASSESESRQKAIEALEGKLSSACLELESTTSSYAACQKEFDAYKVRVHSVLKQQKEKAGPKTDSVQEEMRRKWEEENNALRLELKKLENKLSDVLSEKEEIEEELEKLTSRHDKLIQDASSKDMQLKSRIEELNAEILHKGEENAETLKSLTEENESLTKSFKNQLRVTQQDHRHTVDVLQQQVGALESQVIAYENQAKNVAEENLLLTQQRGLQKLRGERMRAQIVGSDDVFREEREQAEGMEDQSRVPSISSESPKFNLERLLSADESIASSPSPGVAEDKGKSRLQACFKRIEHLTEVLRDSEANSLRLSEQAKVLKEEIRRLERNQEREKNVTNLEYLKNVVIKFLQSRGSEQEHLIPVLTTLLKLSPDECQLIGSIVQPEESSEASEASSNSSSSKWTSYIHKWTGF